MASRVLYAALAVLLVHAVSAAECPFSVDDIKNSDLPSIIANCVRIGEGIGRRFAISEVLCDWLVRVRSTVVCASLKRPLMNVTRICLRCKDYWYTNKVGCMTNVNFNNLWRAATGLWGGSGKPDVGPYSRKVYLGNAVAALWCSSALHYLD